MTLNIKWIKAKFKAHCGNCMREINVRDSILWHYQLKEAMCEYCGNKFFEWLEGGK